MLIGSCKKVVKLTTSKVSISGNRQSCDSVSIFIIKLCCFDDKRDRLQKFVVRNGRFDINVSRVTIQFEIFGLLRISAKTVEDGRGYAQVFVESSQVLRLHKQFVALIIRLQKAGRRQQCVVAFVEKGRILIIGVDDIDGD